MAGWPQFQYAARSIAQRIKVFLHPQKKENNRLTMRCGTRSKTVYQARCKSFVSSWRDGVAPVYTVSSNGTACSVPADSAYSMCPCAPQIPSLGGVASAKFGVMHLHSWWPNKSVMVHHFGEGGAFCVKVLCSDYLPHHKASLASFVGGKPHM